MEKGRVLTTGHLARWDAPHDTLPFRLDSAPSSYPTARPEKHAYPERSAIANIS
jgi:hypothetical protein